MLVSMGDRDDDVEGVGEPYEAGAEPAPAPPVAPATDAPDAPPADPPTPPTTSAIQTVARRNWTRGMLILAGSLLVLVALGFGAARIGETVHKPPAVAALEQIEAADDAESATDAVVDGGTATLHWSMSLGTAVLVTNGLPALADDETFEVWFVQPDGATVSVATFEETEPSMTVALEGTIEPGDVAMVTVEQSGGSATGKPTAEPIVAIPTE